MISNTRRCIHSRCYGALISPEIRTARHRFHASYIATSKNMRLNITVQSGNASEVDIEAAVDAFMKRQAELESGAAFAGIRDPEKIIGADQVSTDEATRLCAEIFEVLRSLKRTRDMSVAEVKLVVSIEDPRTRERRAQADIEDSRGVSRDEMAAALLEVAEGRVPRDRIALKCLHEEMSEWPFLETTMSGAATDNANAAAEAEALKTAAAAASTSPSEYASLLKGGDTVVRPYIMGADLRKGEKPQGLMDMLPSWVGYGALYGISFIPVLLVIVTVLVLFYNSLK
ncbi:hypothetical protein CEUSTIGMA_g8584.t1 [Chlamydomonas eustigma]|uniref:Uncharacterized protein n=1 Tax=Chlamydomonas eustigma TaxID=1157962 RepID=A0A250XDN1_9CHLO|nr:hypothetical protein CEUSTIGMA_g8584.t1 [Chlamydomonas eustigma]|eukprot:GAX81151.1 hypothetical protein CEUSTIGMA_g8584.t1 [Chlamydomonas eustigma]